MPRAVNRCPNCREAVSPFAAGCAIRHARRGRGSAAAIRPWRRILDEFRLRTQSARSAADKASVRERARVLRQLIAGSLYQVDERAVAQAIVARVMLRRTMPEVSFRSGERGPPVRSFRRERDARSFRLMGAPRPRVHHHR
jgi:hypothetical protein